MRSRAPSNSRQPATTSCTTERDVGHRMDGPSKPCLLVMASTYPRWRDDHEPAFVHELARRLSRHFTVHVLAPHAHGAARREELAGVQVHRFRYAPARLETLVNDGGIVTNLRRAPWRLLLAPPFLLSMALAARRLITRLRPAAIHAHWIIPQGAVLALLPLIGTRLPPILLTSHGADLYTMRSRLPSVIKRMAIRHAQAMTVVSEAMTSDAHALGASNVRVQSMGVDLSTLFVPPKRPSMPRRGLLFVGRLVEKKGLRILIEAMPRIRAAQPDIVLTVVGHGPELPTLQARVRELELDAHVEFVGPKPQSELPPLYQQASVFIAPFVTTANGDREGLGLVVVEALGCACPVVVSNLPQVRQTVGPGICATLVTPGCPEALAEAVVARLSTPYEEDRHLLNAADVRARFDWDAVANRYASILDGLLK